MPLNIVEEPGTPVPSTTQYVPPLSEDRVLIDRFQAGDRAAFGELYQRYHARVFGFVVAKVGDRHLGEDLTAETFTRALAALPHLSWCGRDLGAWLFTIARNLITDHVRLSRTRLVSPAPAPGLGLVDNRAEAAPEATAVSHAWLAAAVGQLEPRLREVLVRRVLLDRSVEQTAAELGFHQSMVKHCLRRALRQLAALLLVEVAVV